MAEASLEAFFDDISLTNEISSEDSLHWCIPAVNFLGISDAVYNYREQHPRNTGFADTLEEKSELDFFKHLRVTKATFATILHEIEMAYGQAPPGSLLKLGPKIALYMTLWYLGNSVTYREISELFGFAESTVFESIQRIIDVLCAASAKFIKWPSHEEALEKEREFRQLAGFPRVIGALDGSHINIKAPSELQADYLDRTLRHSINLMAVCTADKIFTFIQAGFPGSAHDSRVFKSTTLGKKLEEDPAPWFPSDNYHLIGDSAFALNKYLQVPFKDTGNLMEHQVSFNSKLSKTRVIIENAFGFLKGRFRKLKYIDADIGRISKIVTACCVLHNIALMHADEETMLENEGIPQTVQRQEPFPEDRIRETSGERKRMAIAICFQRLL